MAAGLKDLPQCLDQEIFQWRSRFYCPLNKNQNGGAWTEKMNTKLVLTCHSVLFQAVPEVEGRPFTSRDGESMESYYSRFYKLMNELTRNNLQVTTMQVNVQFLQQLQPEWSRFVTIVNKQKR
ncbi:hypothetical protein Tco_0212045 [Tanacetum coccineum]